MKSLIKFLVFFLPIQIISNTGYAQFVNPRVACSITGPSPVNVGDTKVYTLSGCNATSWTVTCGSVSSFTANSVTVYFGMTGCSSAVITAKSGSSTLGSKTVTVTAPPLLVGGSITSSPQTISYGATPPVITASVATGGSCIEAGYAYDWQKSPDNVNWGTPPGNINGQNYQPPGLTNNTYYRRRVICGSQVAYTNSVFIGVAMQGGVVAPSTVSIFPGQNPGNLSLSGIVGGTGTYTYQWQSSSTSNFSSPTIINGAVSATYNPGNLSSPTYFRVAVSSAGVPVFYSAYSYVNVYPALQGGSISPATMTINYGGQPTSDLLLGGAGGGNGILTYQWQYSLDNVNWYNYGAARSVWLDEGYLTQTKYYRVAVTCLNLTVYSATAVINVNPQVFPGILSTTDIPITSGTSPGSISATVASGGACGGNYTYLWQSSPDNVNFTNIGSASGLNYTPGNITATTYFRRLASCGTDTVFTNTCKVWITNYSSANFVRVRDLSRPGIIDTASARGLTDPYDVKHVTQYFDGLGRVLETVTRQSTPLQKDLVTLNSYDVYGRESTKYLPYASTSSDGNFKIGPLSEQNSFNSAQFPGEQFYYSRTTYQASPIDRQTASYPAGLNWVGNNRGTTLQYYYNTLSDSVRIWNIADANASIPTTSAIYAAGTLTKNITVDEQNHQIVEYKDKLGKMVLKKVQLISSPGTAHVGWLNTYYIYDDFENLRFVLQPRAVELLLATGSWSITNSIRDELSFYYSYDDQKRMTVKKVPGAWEVWNVYDARDRIVMTQDSNLRAAGKWLVTKYDSENRSDSTGLLTDGNNRIYHQNLAYNSIFYPATNVNFELLTETYYDNYSWAAAKGFSSTAATTYNTNSSYFVTSYNSSPVYAQSNTQYACARGLQTGSRTEVINSGGQYLAAISYYDDHGRIIQTQNLNYTTGKDTAINQYDFTGKLIRNLLINKNAFNNAQRHIVSTKSSYDAGGRLLTIYKNIDDAGSDQLVVTNSYDELSQLQNKQVGNNLDNLAYGYNIRGWLATINKNFISGSANNNYFGLELAYDKTTSVNANANYVNPVFNGNIAGTIWKTSGDGVARKYDFTYDYVNRLTAADFNQANGATFDKTAKIDFSVSGLTYDANGNILSMIQNGFKVGGSAPIDQLTYTYQNGVSNKLVQVNDGANDANSKLGDFHFSGTKQATDYSYDGNGNLNLDNNKAISGIQYNYLNLPQQVTITSKGTITYTYDASGNKLCKTTVDNTVVPAKTTRTTYLYGFVYQATSPSTGGPVAADTLQFIGHEEGRARWAFHKYLNGAIAYGFEYDFFERDHLGNTRVVLTQQKDTAFYLASGEAAYRATEGQLFSNLTPTTTARTSVPSYPNDLTITNPNDTVFKVSGEPGGHKLGPSLLLKVMSGDNIDLSVQSFYNSGTTTTPNSSVTDILASLASGIVTTASGGKGTMSELNNTTTSPLYAALNNFMSNDPNPTGKPKAYLNWILLDEQLNYVSSYPQSGAVVVGSSGVLNTLGYTGLPITKNGYLYIWVSNETPNWNVFFDNLVVKHYAGPLIEETHYYPFGLTMAAICSKALKTNYAENFKRYNGIEYDSTFGLDEYEAYYRDLDPQTGRWWQIDPKIEDANENVSPYASMADDPIRHSDPLGDVPGDETNGGGGVGVLQSVGDGLMKGVRWINTNVNPLTPLVELATGKSVESDLTEDKSRTTAALEGALFLVPELKVEGAIVRSAEGALVKGESKALVNTAEKSLADNAGNATAKIHGNSKASTSATTLYKLETKEGKYLKTGVTSRANPEKRYSKSFMKDKKMTIMDKGSRANMLKKERAIVEKNPGPLNKEPWAGKKQNQ